MDHLAAISGRKGNERKRIHELRHESDGAVAHEHIGAAKMIRLHLIGVTKWIVWCVNDDLGMVVGVGTGVSTDETSRAVVLRGPGLDVEPWRRHRARNDSNPSLVA